MTPEELRAWRATMNLTQNSAADALGLSLRGYKNYELGETNPPPFLALACAALYHRLKPWSLGDET